MVAKEFIDLLTNSKVTYFVGVEDFSDQLSFQFTVIILIICGLVLAMKEYIFSPLACYTPVLPSAKSFDSYLSNYCWVHGTVPMKPGEALPISNEDWNTLESTRKISYYQWIPFFLGLQCICFYLPRLTWQLLCYTHTDTNLQNLVETASSAVHSSSKPVKKIGYIAEMMDNMLYQRREYRSGRLVNFKRRVHETFSFCVISKRFGTWLVFAYFIVKLLFLTNAIAQLYMMQRFLGFNDTTPAFGMNALRYLLSGNDSRETLMFPRVSICNINNVRLLGATNNYVAQCALPINMISEKIYIFLWFWCIFISIVTAISIPFWLFKLGFKKSRRQYVTKVLKKMGRDSSEDHLILREFVHEFLRHDGVFLIHMIALNAGDLITSAILKRMFQIYTERYNAEKKLCGIGEFEA